MQTRRTGRELALLGMSQLPSRPEQLQKQDLENLVLAAVRTLAAEARDALETAADELKRGNDRLVDSQTLASNLDSGRVMVEDAIHQAQQAINRIGTALELPEFLQTANQRAVKAIALELLTTAARNLSAVDDILDASMVAWNMRRLPRIDRDILRLAVVEIQYLGTPDRVAINEAVELAKRYSEEEGYRFINGVLRRVVSENFSPKTASQTEPLLNSES